MPTLFSRMWTKVFGMAHSRVHAPSAVTRIADQSPTHRIGEQTLRGDWLLAHAAAIPWQELVGGKLISNEGTRLMIVEVVVRARHEPLMHVRSGLDANGPISRHNLEPFRAGRFTAVVLKDSRAKAVTAAVLRTEERHRLKARRQAEHRARLEQVRQEEIQRREEQRRAEARRYAREQIRAEQSRQEETRRREAEERRQEAAERARINAARQFDLVLFDLDDTLLATGGLADFRRKANLSPADPGAYLAALLDRSSAVAPLVVQEDLEVLRGRFPNLAMGVFSRSPRAYVKALLEAHYPRIRWDCVVAYEDVAGRTKPAPDGVLLAMNLVGINDAGRVAVVGDDSVDVLAAYQAGAVPIVSTRAWGGRWRDRDNPKRTSHYRTLDWVPDVVLEDPRALASTIVEPWATLPALEAWDRCQSADGPPMGRVAKINRFHPTLNMAWVSCHVLGRYFPAHSSKYDFERKRATHAVTRRILEAKDGMNYPESWVACCRWYVLRLLEESWGLTGHVIVCPIPARPERPRRMEHFLDRLRDRLLGTDGVAVDNEILRFSPDTQANKSLGKADRFRNIEAHLAVASPDAVVGATVIVVDDVATTGATLYYADRYLRAAGATDVHCVALTKAIS